MLETMARSQRLTSHRLAPGLYQRDMFVYYVGQAAGCAYEVETGHIQISHYTAEGEDLALRTARPGETFGLEEYYLRIPRRLSAHVVSVRAEVRRIQPELSTDAALNALGALFEETTWRLALQAHSAEDRLRAYLPHIAGTVAGTVIPLNQAQMAAELGLQRETVCRVIRALVADGSLIQNGSVFRIGSLPS